MMKSCQTILQQLAGLSAEERACDADVVEHLARCPTCQEQAAAWDDFDSLLRSRITDVEVPKQLESELIKLVAAATDQHPASVIAPQARGLAPGPIAATSQTQSRWKIWGAVTATVMTVCLLALFSALHAPQQSQPLDYHAVRSEISQQFFRADVTWEQYHEFDNSFPVEQLDRSLRKWRLSPAVGVDLGNSDAHDAAVFRFDYRHWKGVLVVVPTEATKQAPSETIPVASSSRRVLEWRSADGELSYLCYVETGSAMQLVQATFGSMS